MTAQKANPHFQLGNLCHLGVSPGPTWGMTCPRETARPRRLMARGHAAQRHGQDPVRPDAVPHARLTPYQVPVRRSFLAMARKDRPRSCHIRPTAAPRMITTPTAMKNAIRPNTTPIGPYFWS
jgi:hypothetical protein